MGNEYSEDNLVEQATIDILEDLGWSIETAWHNETMGEDGLLGREKKSEVILKKFLIPQLKRLNPSLPPKAYREAYEIITRETTDSRIGHINHKQYHILKDGVEVSFTNEKGELEERRLKIFDYDTPIENHFLAVRQLEVHGKIDP